MKKLNRNQKLMIVFFFIAIIAIGILVYITQFATKTRSKASSATTLSFSPATATAGVGDSITSDIMLAPATGAQVSTVTFILGFDSTKLSLPATSVVRNSDAFSQILDGPSFNPIGCGDTTPSSICKVEFSLGIGTDPSKIITTQTKVATLTFTAKTEGSTSVAFDPLSSVSELNSQNNILSSTSPLDITIGTVSTPSGTITPTVPACQPNMATCSWDKSPDASVTTYHVKIEDQTLGKIIQESDVPATQNSVSFPIVFDDLTKCTVTAKSNKCPGSEDAFATNKCTIPPTPTPTTTPTPTDTPTPTPTPTITTTPGPTPVNKLPVCTGLNVDRSTTGSAPYAITFTGIGNDPDGTITKAVFNFGDGPTQEVTTGGGIGTKSVSVQIAHNFQNPGTYSASVSFVDDKSGQSITNTACAQAITITIPPTGPPHPTTPPPPPVSRPTVVIVNKPLAKTGPGDVFVGAGIVGGILSVIGALLMFGL